MALAALVSPTGFLGTFLPSYSLSLHVYLVMIMLLCHT